MDDAAHIRRVFHFEFFRNPRLRDRGFFPQHGCERHLARIGAGPSSQILLGETRRLQPRSEHFQRLRLAMRRQLPAPDIATGAPFFSQNRLAELHHPLRELLPAPIPAPSQMAPPPVSLWIHRHPPALVALRRRPPVEPLHERPPPRHIVRHPEKRQPPLRSQPFRPLMRRQRISARQTAPRIIQNTTPLRHIHQTRTARIQVNVIP